MSGATGPVSYFGKRILRVPLAMLGPDKGAQPPNLEEWIYHGLFKGYIYHFSCEY